ncbi:MULTISPECIES: helix-turn-helix domain-containing protein [Streptomyces]|uniref:helix-turn-helix domain-containing protein n=2 Tax=Streptomyces TaxID=1883 RepID=UPI001CEF801E|nr:MULTISPECIES: helix-turn-helix domain-containing protein [Streptomyces]
MAMLAHRQEVRFLRWPVQSHERERLREAGLPCLLVLEGRTAPPGDISPTEDWVRPPVDRLDLAARVHTLQRRTGTDFVPALDPTGVLYYGGHSVPMSEAQSEMMRCFLADFGHLVRRDRLKEALSRITNEAVTSNAIDLHIMRLRQRLDGVRLSLRTVWGRGYILEPAS